MSEVKSLNLLCANYSPVLDPSKIIIAGSGPGTYLKEVKIN